MSKRISRAEDANDGLAKLCTLFPQVTAKLERPRLTSQALAINTFSDVWASIEGRRLRLCRHMRVREHSQRQCASFTLCLFARSCARVYQA